MGYVVVVMVMLNVAAWAGASWVLWVMTQDIGKLIRTEIQDEVRRQDDRIEKRLAKVGGKVENAPDELKPEISDGIRAGRPVRR